MYGRDWSPFPQEFVRLLASGRDKQFRRLQGAPGDAQESSQRLHLSLLTVLEAVGLEVGNKQSGPDRMAVEFQKQTPRALVVC